MSEDYLWDMTGSNAEIEKLEAALGRLAYKGGAAPKVQLKKKRSLLAMFTPSFGLRAGLAMASVAAICFVSLWMTQPKHNVVTVPDLIVEPKQPVIRTDETVNPPEPPIEGPKQGSRQGFRREVFTVSYKPQRQSKHAKRVNRSAPIIVTPEEAAAYNKLMLALSITSTNLRIVKDAVAGNYEKTPDVRSYK